MALTDGDYRRVEEKAVAVLRSDTDPAGLRETGNPAVAVIRAGDPSLIRAFGQADFPALLLRVLGKTELPLQPAYSILKRFHLRAVILARSMEREDAEEKVRKIAARLEEVLRGQTATDKQFQGLPDEITGAEGVLVCLIRETRFPETAAGEDTVLARAETDFEIHLPCLFRFE